MQNDLIPVSVCRFRDLVQVSVGNGESVYIKPQDARALAKALLDCENDIVERPVYQHSEFTPKDFLFQGKR